MSIVGAVVNDRLAIETFNNVVAANGTVVVRSQVFPVVERAAVLEFVGTADGQLGTIGGNLWVSGVGVGAFTGATPNTIVIRAVTNAGDYLGTIAQIKVLVVR